MDNEFLPDLYELEDENGNKQTFELLDAMEYGDEKYYALTPYYENGDEALEDSGDVVILKAEYDENNDEILASIEDDDEYEKMGQMFMERIDEMFELTMRTKTMIAAVAAVVTITTTCHKKDISAYRLVNM